MARATGNAYNRGFELGAAMSADEVGEFLQGFARAIGPRMMESAHGTHHVVDVLLEAHTQLIQSACRMSAFPHFSPARQENGTEESPQQTG